MIRITGTFHGGHAHREERLDCSNARPAASSYDTLYDTQTMPLIALPGSEIDPTPNLSALRVERKPCSLGAGGNSLDQTWIGR